MWEHGICLLSQQDRYLNVGVFERASVIFETFEKDYIEMKSKVPRTIARIPKCRKSPRLEEKIELTDTKKNREENIISNE